MLVRVAGAVWADEEAPLSNRYVHRRATAGSVDDHADWSWGGARGGRDVESLGDTGDDQGPLRVGREHRLGGLVALAWDLKTFFTSVAYGRPDHPQVRRGPHAPRWRHRV